MKNLTIKTMCACGKEVTEKAYVDQRIKEMLNAGLIPKIAPDTFAIVHAAEPERAKPEGVAGNNNLKVFYSTKNPYS